MRNIILLRHAKSSWKDASLDDFERPLNNRGKRDASHMANRLLERGVEVDLIISSSAKRTSDTAKIFSDILGLKAEIIFEHKLYEASTQEILKIIHKIEEKYKSLLIVCHNPGITNLSNYLSNYFIDNIPTTGAVGFSLDGNWNELQNNSCKLIFFDYPKKL
jgi:phosphohistidine phosphatase